MFVFKDGFPKLKIFLVSIFSKLGPKGSSNIKFNPNSKKVQIIMAGGGFKKIIDFLYFWGHFFYFSGSPYKIELMLGLPMIDLLFLSIAVFIRQSIQAFYFIFVTFFSMNDFAIGKKTSTRYY